MEANWFVMAVPAVAAFVSAIVVALVIALAKRDAAGPSPRYC